MQFFQKEEIIIVIGASFLGATPGTDYVIYAYGFEFVDGEMIITTELCKLQVTTKDVEVADAFMGVDVTVNGASATVSFDAGDYDGRYFAFVEDVEYLLGDGNVPAEEDIPAIITDIWYQYLSMYLQYGFSIEMLFGEYTQVGSAQLTYDLYANSTWVAAALPIDERGVAIAHPTIEIFETEPVEPSDNQIDIEVYDIQARSAYTTLTPTNDDPYVFACMSSQYLAGMSDDEIITFIFDSYYYNLTNHIRSISCCLHSFHGFFHICRINCNNHTKSHVKSIVHHCFFNLTFFRH